MDCHIDDDKIVLKKNGKSFHWAGKFLKKECINRAAELYSFCRILDDIADSGEANSHNHLINIKSIIKKHTITELENNYSIKYPKFLKSSSRKVVIDLIDGLILDQKGVLFEQEEELIRYSYHVAGTVGIMMCDALKCNNGLAKSFAIDLGIAMQLTNIARGIKKLLILAEQYYLSGEKGFTFLPFNTRVAISVASGVYREIGVQLENENYNWQNGRQITSIFSKIKITLFKTFKEIFYLRNKKKHNSELHIYLENLVNDKKGN